MVVRIRNKRSKEKTAKQSLATKKDVSALGKAIRTLGGAAGGALGSYFGQPMAGGAVGTSLGAALSKWLGAGDYTVGTNSVVKQSMRAAGSIPAMHAEGQTVVIRHREYLGEIISSQSYAVQQSFPINPGLSTTFPWLSNIANSFQEYKIRGMVFHYIPTSGVMGSTTSPALGSVMLQTSYRSTDTPPLNKVELLNEFWSNEVVPSDTMAHPIECDPKENPFNVQYVRSGSVPVGETQLMYDLGVTHVAVSGCQVDGKTLGDLWVTYDIELKKPLVASNVTSQVEAGFFNTTSGFSTAGPFGTGSSTGSLAFVVTNSGGSIFTFPKGTVGTYLIEATAIGTFSSASISSVTYGNCTAGAPFGTTAIERNIASSTGISFTAAFTCNSPSVIPFVYVTYSGVTSVSSAAVTIARIA